MGRMTLAQFEERLAKAKRWYYPSPTGDEDIWEWYKTHDEETRKRWTENYFAMDQIRGVLDMVRELWNVEGGWHGTVQTEER